MQVKSLALRICIMIYWAALGASVKSKTWSLSQGSYILNEIDNVVHTHNELGDHIKSVLNALCQNKPCRKLRQGLAWEELNPHFPMCEGFFLHSILFKLRGEGQHCLMVKARDGESGDLAALLDFTNDSLCDFWQLVYYYLMVVSW